MPCAGRPQRLFPSVGAASGATLSASAGRWALLLLTAALACGTPGPLDSPPRRYADADVAGRSVGAASAEAQAWFDQGLTLMYGFNHDEAVRSFAEAARLDPECCMAWWGLALASGTDINDSRMTADDCERAYQAAQRAVQTASGAAPLEAALARAVATRYAWPAPDDRRPLDEAYAAAMQQVFQAAPGDPDVATLFAESLMLLQPWKYWTAEGEPKGRIVEAIDALERGLAQEPDHAGACHYLIHALEAGEPDRAEAAADRLAQRVPGAGHLLHMPSHIYVHLGRYADGADCNERAVAADRAYFAAGGVPGSYTLYYAHNLHMLAFAAMMEGREALALQAANDLVSEIPEDFIRAETAMVDGLMATPLHVMVRFGRWDEILAQPAPPDWRTLSVAQQHYARGVALSALGRPAEARLEQAAFEAAAARVPDDWRAGANTAGEVLALARQMLLGELLWREGRADEAFAALSEGVRLEDAMVYDEPPGWMQPVRHAYGALLMAAGEAREAERVYRDDLLHNPGNGWSLLGLQLALEDQGRSVQAQVVAGQLARAWARADCDASSSCFCEPGAVAAALEEVSAE